MMNSRGFTLTEVLTGIALMGIVTFGIVNGTTMLFRNEAQTGTISNESKYIQTLIDNISADPALYQKNFSSKATNSTNSILAPDNMPLAFAEDYFGPRDVCKDRCKGFVGYVIRPVIGLRGLFEVTLRVAKPVMAPNGLPKVPAEYDTRDYVFVTQSN